MSSAVGSKRRLLYAIVTLLFWVLSDVQANDLKSATVRPSSACRDAVRGQSESNRTSFPSSFEEIPQLRTLLLEVLADPGISLPLKAQIQKAITNDRANLVLLTEELRRELNLPADVAGLQQSTLKNIEVVNEGSASYGDTVSSQITNVDSLRFENVVAINRLSRDATRQEQETALLVLVHELAHARFDAFLDRNAEALFEILPAGLAVRTPSGKIRLKRALFDFLQERYALETEFRFLREAFGVHIKTWPHFWHPTWKDMPLTQALGRIGRYTLDVYEIHDPEVQSLATISLRALLLGQREQYVGTGRNQKSERSKP